MLETPRLLLEPLGTAHAAALYEPLRDPRLYTFIPQEPPPSLHHLEERYARLVTRHSPDGTQTWLNWALRQRDRGRYAGLVEATVLRDGRALLAYMVFPAFQRQGYGREGSARVIAHLFSDFNVTAVVVNIDTRNGASIHLAESLGFARVAIIPGADLFKGATSDEYCYVLRRAEGQSDARA